MKKLIFLTCIFCLSCTTIKQVPIIDDFPTHVKGNVVKVKLNTSRIVYAELISVNKDRLIYLIENDKENIVKSIDLRNITSMEVILSKTHNAENVESSGYIGAMTLGHGWFSLFTIPINIAVIANANKTYRVKELSWDSLSKFARFPQGIPEGISLSDLTEK